MNKLLMLRSIPAAGKTTFAKQLVARGGWIRVNNDDLRESLHNGKWSKHNERLIDSTREFIIKEALLAGDNVVVDNLNLHPKHRQRLQDLAAKYGAQFEEKFFDVTLEVAIERDLKRPNSVGHRVIEKWHRDYIAESTEIITYTPPKDKPEAYLFDIDGTLAHGIGITRKPYEWHKVGTDTVDEGLRHILMSIKGYDVMADPEYPVEIILMSGRDSVCRAETEEWLKVNGIPYGHLYMRPEGDKRKDYEVKKELFEQHIRNEYNVQGVFDDRWGVCRLWLSMGLKVYNVSGLDRGDF